MLAALDGFAVGAGRDRPAAAPAGAGRVQVRRAAPGRRPHRERQPARRRPARIRAQLQAGARSPASRPGTRRRRSPPAPASRSPSPSMTSCSSSAAMSPCIPTAARSSATAPACASSGSMRSRCKVGDRLKLKVATAEYPIEVEQIPAVIDVEKLQPTQASEIGRNAIAEITVRSRALMALDLAADMQRTGRGVLLRQGEIVGGALVLERRGERRRQAPDRPRPSRHARRARGGQRPSRRGAVADRPLRLRQVDPRHGPGAPAVPARAPGLRARRRPAAPGRHQRPRLLARGPRGKYPALRRGGEAAGRCRPGGDRLPDLALRGGPRPRPQASSANGSTRSM